MIDIYGAQMVARDEHEAMKRRLPSVSDFATSQPNQAGTASELILRLRSSLGTALVAVGTRISAERPSVTATPLHTNSKAASRS